MVTELIKVGFGGAGLLIIGYFVASTLLQVFLSGR
jgi:hypothetical protein